MADTGVVCRYCDSPVPAAKTCLLCDVSLCDDHLRVHSRSEEHVLYEPSSALQNRSCPIHNENFKYYCPDDALCLCESCLVMGDHEEHHVEALLEASEKMKEHLRDLVEKLIVQKEEAEKDIQSLHKESTTVQHKQHYKTMQIAALFQDIRRQLYSLEKQVLSDISKQVMKTCQPVSECIQQLEIKKEELSGKIYHIEKLCNMTDPLTLLQGGTTNTADFCDTNTERANAIPSYAGQIQGAGDLDEGLISVTVYKGLSDIISGAKERLHVKRSSDMLFDVKTAGEYLDISEDLRMAKTSRKKHSRPRLAERFLYSQVLSTVSFSSGRHYWEVETSESGNWRIGVSYLSIHRRGEQSYIGDNIKSWCLGGCNGLYTMMHNKEMIHLYQTSASCRTLGIYLDYEAGRLSFYVMGDPIRHLHTFTTTFTEPLHAAFGVWNSCLKIKN